MDNNENSENVSSTWEPSGARIRTQSECSATSSEDGAHGSSASGKRQRTTSASQQFMVISDITSASPPKFVSLEEIMQAANSIKDMALVHQIVVDDGFKLKRVETPPNSIQSVIKETIHKAYWDVLRSDLADDPPEYGKVLNLLEDIKIGFFNLLLPQHTKIKRQISEVLDKDLIQQQAENNCLNFKYYADYILSVMGKLCAPVRDEKIKELKETNDIVDTFRGILETLDLMLLDMANFTLQAAKPDIIAQSVELERRKFADFLVIQPDGLECTRKWLLKHVQKEEIPNDYETFIKKKTKLAFNKACLDLLEWNEKEPYPETFMLDVTRLRDLQIKTNRLIILGTIFLITLSNAGPDLQSIASFKTALKDHLLILLESLTDEKKLDDLLPNIAEQVLKDIKNARSEHRFAQLNEATENAIKQQILGVSTPDHRIKSLIRQRIKDFYYEIIESATAAPQQVPSGLSSLQKELTTIVGQFLKIVSHNCTVFSIYYYDIVCAAIPKPTV